MDEDDTRSLPADEARHAASEANAPIRTEMGRHAVVLLDHEQRIVKASGLERFGLDNQAVLGKPCYLAFHALGEAPANCPFRLAQFRDAHGPYSLAVVCNEHPLDCVVSPGNAETGLTVATLLEEEAWYSDEPITTPQNVAEKAQRYDLIVSTMNVGLVFQDAEGRVLDANPAAARILGLSPEQLHGRSSYDARWRAIRPDGSPFPGEEHPAMRALASGKPVRDVVMGIYHPPRDEHRWILITAIPQFRFGETRAYQVYTSFTDITSLRLVESELRQSNANFHMLAHTARDAITLADENGLITYWNAAAERLLGYAEREILGQNMKLLLSLSDFELLTRSAFAAETEGSGRQTLFEISARHKSGTSVPVEINVSAFTQGHSRVLVGIMRDAAERTRAAGEKARLEEQLRQAVKMEAIGRLAGGVAHDFNNLLTGITGNVDIALMDLTPNDPLVDTLNELKKAAEKAAGLTRQLLSFSRKQVREKRPLNLNQNLQNIRRLLDRIIGEDVRLVSELDDDIPMLLADPGQIEQVVVNLCVNARDAMPQGGVLSLRTKRIEKTGVFPTSGSARVSGVFVELIVEDTGIGMTREVMEHLFEPFFTTKPRGKGTGLGLATLFGIVQGHEGHIEVDSTLGVGSAFHVFLPAADAAQLEAFNAEESVESAYHPERVLGGNETVLVVEDESLVRDIVHKTLLRLGYNVMVAGNGLEAMRLVDGYYGGIDLLLTDVVMPQMNGRELAHALMPKFPDMRVLYTSGYTADIISSHGVLEEGIQLLAKPYTPQSLARKVREVLSKSPRRVEVGTP